MPPVVSLEERCEPEPLPVPGRDMRPGSSDVAGATVWFPPGRDTSARTAGFRFTVPKPVASLEVFTAMKNHLMVERRP
jgi:hypothetical protein